MSGGRSVCVVCGADDDGIRYWLRGRDGPIACIDCAPLGSARNDHPYRQNGGSLRRPGELSLAAKLDAAQTLLDAGAIDKRETYLDLLSKPQSEWPSIIAEQGPGLSARYPDATTPPVFKSRLSDDWQCQVVHAYNVAGYELRAWPRGDPGADNENVARILVPYGATKDVIEAAANKLIAAALDRCRAAKDAT